jgi:hypothetical protein
VATDWAMRFTGRWRGGLWTGDCVAGVAGLFLVEEHTSSGGESRAAATAASLEAGCSVSQRRRLLWSDGMVVERGGSGECPARPQGSAALGFDAAAWWR